jgi:hypothetical protein
MKKQLAPNKSEERGTSFHIIRSSIAWSHKPPSDVLSPVIQFNILSENTQVPELESPASMVTTLPHVLYLKV